MRFGLLLSAALTLMSATAFAQSFVEYANREEGFSANFPSAPDVRPIRYTTASGETVAARVYSSEDGTSRYSMTVVDLYTTPADEAGAMAHAASALRKKGDVRFDGPSELDGVHGHQLAIVEPDSRRSTLVQIYLYDHRLYIAEGSVAPGSAPPAQFQTSITMIHLDGKVVNLRREGLVPPDPR